SRVYPVDELREGEGRSWDVAIVKSDTLNKKSLYTKFVFVLGEENQVISSNAMSLVDIQLYLTRGNQFQIRAYSTGSPNYDSMNDIGDEIFNKNCYPFLDFVPDVQVIVDVGANIGLASVYFRAHYPEATIHSFECDPLTVYLLKQNAVSIGNCQVHPVRLYSEDIEHSIQLNLQNAISSSTDVCHSFYQPRQFRKASSYLKDINVERVDILKVDDAGSELKILTDLSRNAPGQLSSIKVIYVKFYAEEDGRLIDQLLSLTHVLWQGDVLNAHRGNLCYLHRSYVPQVLGAEPLGR
ncbi:MAG: FkbM family methyltransferase, partial [Thermostichus sp. DG02_1_bins_55]